MPEVRRILVVKLSAFGDLLHAVPIVHRLAEIFSCPVDWVTQPEYVELVNLHQDVDRVIAFPRKGGVSEWGAFRKELRQDRYDLAVDLQGLAKSGLVMGLARATRKIGCAVSREGAQLFVSERPPATDAVHAFDRLQDTLRFLQIPLTPAVYPMNWPKVAEPEGRRPRVGLAVKSRWPAKDWPLENFHALGERLIQEQGASIHVLGGPADRETGTQLAEALGEHATSHCGTCSLEELGGLLQHLDVVVSNDSGPMHLAAAVGRPLVALFGPTDPALTGPWGEGHVVLRPPAGPDGYPDHRSYKAPDAGFIARISVEEVFEEVVKQLGEP